MRDKKKEIKKKILAFEKEYDEYKKQYQNFQFERLVYVNLRFSFAKEEVDQILKCAEEKNGENRISKELLEKLRETYLNQEMQMCYTELYNQTYDISKLAHLNEIRMLEGGEQERGKCFSEILKRCVPELNDDDNVWERLQHLEPRNIKNTEETNHQEKRLFNVIIAPADENSKDSHELNLSVLQCFMYSVFRTKEFELDVYYDLYFSLLYKHRREQKKTVSLFADEWGKETISSDEEMGKGFVDVFGEHYRNYKKTPEGGYWLYKEEEAAKSNSKEKKILDVAPNVARMWILSSRFRNMFRSIKEYERKEYRFLVPEIKAICEEWKLDLRLDDKWVIEQLLGCDLAIAVYELIGAISDKSLRDNILQMCGEEKIEKIVKALIQWPGLFSRIVLVNRYKDYYSRYPGITDKISERLEHIFQEQDSFNIYFTSVYNDIFMSVWADECNKNRFDEELILWDLEGKIVNLRKEVLGAENIFAFDKELESIRMEPIYKYIQGKVLENKKL